MINRALIVYELLTVNICKILASDKKKKYWFIFRDRGSIERNHLPWEEAIYYYRFEMKGNYLRIYKMKYDQYFIGLGRCIGKDLLIKKPFSKWREFISEFKEMTPEMDWFVMGESG